MDTNITNKKAYFNYEILETYEAGIELKGFEVKAIKTGKASIVGSFVIVKNNEAWLLNADIPPYQPANTPPDYDPKRTRRLLLKKEEIKELIGKTHENGLTIVPLKLYNKNGKIKIEIGIGRGKKKTDKRETIKKREWSRLRRNIETR
ncbi:MAG: SsrA-binding protein SmpB [Patescibacteria group bacterium]